MLQNIRNAYNKAFFAELAAWREHGAVFDLLDYKSVLPIDVENAYQKAIVATRHKLAMLNELNAAIEKSNEETTK